MKKLYIIFSVILITAFGYSQNPNDFIMTYEVNNTTGLGVKYPFYGGEFTIDLGDGNTLTGDDVNITSIHHTYAAPGIYTIVVSGDVNRVRFADIGYNMRLKARSIEQWGTVQWITMEGAFKDLQNLTVNATDIPDLSLVTNMSEMFFGAESFNSTVNNWDVSSVTNMNRLFSEAFTFNQPLDNWDVSNVTDMGEMFARAVSFNQNIDNWDVSNVTNMVHMFGGFPEDNISFNQPLNSWDVSSVTEMYWMFRNAILFNQPLDNWDVSNVTDMGAMFLGASSFNQNIDNWDVSNVIYMADMFYDATAFNQPLNSWDVSNVVYLQRTFYNATSFNKPLDNWDVSNALSIDYILYNASSFNQDLSGWDYSSIGGIYRSVSKTALDIDNYDALLLAFAQSGRQNIDFDGDDLYYCNEAVRSYLIDEAGWEIFNDQLSVNCIDYTISGAIYFDMDNDGCDAEDVPVNGVMISAINSNFDYGTSSLDATYSLNVAQGIYDVSLVNALPYFDVSPITTSITLDEMNTSQVVDFCLTINQSVNDLTTTLLALTEARPGFEAHYQLVVQNQGTVIVDNVTATLNFDDTKQNFVTSIPAVNTSTASSISYNLGTLQPFQTATIDITLQTFAPPTVNADDVINFTAIASPIEDDATPGNNTYAFEHTVVNSFDPNDKQVMQGSEIFEDETDQYLDYIIRFQNTGTASAVNVRLQDILDDKLDVLTFQPISASHPFHVQLEDSNEVEFIFNNINLPDQTTNEAESQGYLAFKIKPKTNVQAGDIITGSASIFFDYNAPIITNTVQTEIIQTLGISEVDNTDELVRIYPNPTDNELFIIANSSATLEHISITNIEGRILMTIDKLNLQRHTINVSAFETGIYFVYVKTTVGIQTFKIIKKE